jgi:hypothetical protein
VVALRIVLVVVHAEDEREILALGGRADDDLLGACIDVALRFFFVGEEAGAFEDDVDAEVLPRKLLRIFHSEDFDVLAAHGDGRLLGADLGRLERAVDAVVLEKVGEGFRVGEIVDGDDFDVGHLAFDERSQHAATDSPETIDTNLGGHDESSGGGVIRRLQRFSGQAPARGTFRARNALRKAGNDTDFSRTGRNGSPFQVDDPASAASRVATSSSVISG